MTGETVKLAFVDQGYTGKDPAAAALQEGIELHVVKLQEDKKGLVLLPRRRVVERSFGNINRFRRLARDYECLPWTLAGLHFVVFSILMLGNAASLIQGSLHALGIENSRPRCVLLTFFCAFVLSGCKGDRLGELQLKPIYADLSGSYYGGMCEGEVRPGTSVESVRAARIGTVSGDCAVLYLDGVDRAGELVIYGAKAGAPPECSDLVRKLEVGRANAAVLARAREVCKQ